MISGVPKDQELWRRHHNDDAPQLIGIVYHTRRSGGWQIPYDPKSPLTGRTLLQVYFSNIKTKMARSSRVSEEVDQLCEWKLQSLTKNDLEQDPHGFMQRLIRMVEELIQLHSLHIVGLSVEVKC